MLMAPGIRTPPRSAETHLKAARWLARAMDARWHIGPLRFGIEPFFNLVPGLGDASSLAVSLYQIVLAMRLALPTSKIARMIVNVGFDFLFALIPVAGDLADLVFKVHLRNQRILDDHIERTMFGRNAPLAFD